MEHIVLPAGLKDRHHVKKRALTARARYHLS
jgi:hypothetical protein